MFIGDEQVWQLIMNPLATYAAQSTYDVRDSFTGWLTPYAPPAPDHEQIMLTHRANVLLCTPNEKPQVLYFL